MAHEEEDAVGDAMDGIVGWGAQGWFNREIPNAEIEAVRRRR